MRRRALAPITDIEEAAAGRTAAALIGAGTAAPITGDRIAVVTFFGRLDGAIATNRS